MSGAHDTKPVYPDEQESITIFENTYEQYRQRISKYFSLKLNPLVADDLTQQVFLKAVENIHSFKGSSNLFTRGDIAIMSIHELISIVNKGENHYTNDRTTKVHQDLFDELNNSVERVSTKYKHHPSQKVVIEIYPDLPTFHQAVGETDAPNWFMGTHEGRTLKIVSPLNPGPEHTYQSILKGTVHLFAMWLISDINPAAPKWIRQGIGGYEAKHMSQDFIKGSTEDNIRNQSVPSFDELNNDTWDFETMKGFQFSYMMVEFVVDRYGVDALNKLIRNPQDFEGIFQCSETELYEQWVKYIEI